MSTDAWRFRHVGLNRRPDLLRVRDLCLSDYQGPDAKGRLYRVTRLVRSASCESGIRAWAVSEGAHSIDGIDAAWLQPVAAGDGGGASRDLRPLEAKRLAERAYALVAEWKAELSRCRSGDFEPRRSGRCKVDFIGTRIVRLEKVLARARAVWLSWHEPPPPRAHVLDGPHAGTEVEIRPDGRWHPVYGPPAPCSGCGVSTFYEHTRSCMERRGIVGRPVAPEGKKPTFFGIPRAEDPKSRAFWDTVDKAAERTAEIAARVAASTAQSDARCGASLAAELPGDFGGEERPSFCDLPKGHRASTAASFADRRASIRTSPRRSAPREKAAALGSGRRVASPLLVALARLTVQGAHASRDRA